MTKADSRCATELRLPWPPKELHPNRAVRLHWAVKAKARKAYRELVAWECRAQAAHVMLQPPVSAKVVFVVRDRRHRDADNLMAALKAAWDGMVDAGLLQDDRASMLRHEAPEVEYRKGEHCVLVTLRGVE